MVIVATNFMDGIYCFRHYWKKSYSLVPMHVSTDRPQCLFAMVNLYRGNRLYQFGNYECHGKYVIIMYISSIKATEVRTKQTWVDIYQNKDLVISNGDSFY